MTPPTRDFVLASASPRRVALLDQIGLKPLSIVPANLNEDAAPNELPRSHAIRIASQKARTVHARVSPGAVVLAADTVVACGRRILAKAEDDAAVTKCLMRLSGRRHTVITAVAVIDAQGMLRTRTIETKVAFKRLEPAEIAAYVRSGEGVGKAGGYAIQGRAAAFVRFISGSYTNVVGLPLTETLGMLRACGVAGTC